MGQWSEKYEKGPVLQICIMRPHEGLDRYDVFLGGDWSEPDKKVLDFASTEEVQEFFKELSERTYY